MTPLQKIAMGLVIVLVDAFFSGYDAVPDPVGWAMVLAGLVLLRSLLPSGSGLLMLAGLCLLVAVATYPPAVSGALDESGGWALSLPQLGFSFWLCTEIAGLDSRFAGRFLTLRWAFAAAAVGPVLVFGGGIEALRSPIALLIVLADVYLVYLLFRASSQVPAPASTE